MLSLNLFFVPLALIAFTQVQALKTDYYWREYTGEVPEDAIVAGRDVNGKDIYIGQAYVKDKGLIVAQIFPGKKQVTVAINGIHTVDKFVKILCGPQEKFFWMAAESKNLHLALIDKHAVIGGHDDGGGYIGVGRISHGGEVKVGKINMFYAERANFYLDDNGSERAIMSYQILMYDDRTIDVWYLPPPTVAATNSTRDIL